METPIITDQTRQAAVQELLRAEVPIRTITNSAFDVQPIPNGTLLVRIAPFYGDLDECIREGGMPLPFEKINWNITPAMSRILAAMLNSVADAVEAAVSGAADPADYAPAAEAEHCGSPLVHEPHDVYRPAELGAGTKEHFAFICPGTPSPVDHADSGKTPDPASWVKDRSELLEGEE